MGEHGLRFLRAGVLTAVVDGLFSSVLVVAAYGSTFTRLWQGVASVLLGPRAFEGGARTVAVGLLMHVVVAFAWAAVFLFVLMRVGFVRRLIASRFGILEVAALYGPVIWMVMSLVVIPLLVQRPPDVHFRWWVQFLGHIPFVAVPIVWGSVGGRRGNAAPEAAG